MKRFWVFTVSFVCLTCVNVLYCIDHAAGPWNIELSAGAYLESNSNVYYSENDEHSDIVGHLSPSVRVEYQKFNNILFESELTFDSFMYFDNSDANITETSFHAQFKPIKSGAYGLVAEDYKFIQNYSPSEGVIETGVNLIRGGGGHRGHHLDFVLTGELETASYSPSDYSSLDYSETSLNGDVEYLFESFYMLGNFKLGSLDYAESSMNDGTFTQVAAGVGKNYYPKNKAEILLGYRSQSHDNDGDSFQGLIMTVSSKHVFSSGKGHIRALLGKSIEPSSTGGEDFTELTQFKLRTSHNITSKFAGIGEISIEWESTGSRDDTIYGVFLKGRYTPKDLLPLKYIRRKKKTPSRRKEPLITIDFGLRNLSRNSDDGSYEFNQTRLFVGSTIVY